MNATAILITMKLIGVIDCRLSHVLMGQVVLILYWDNLLRIEIELLY